MLLVKILAPLTLAVSIIALWNVWAAKRDAVLFDRYLTCSSYWECTNDND